MAITVDDVRRIAAPLPRAYEVLVRDRVKFRVGSIVWLAFSRDETQMGFAFPREERTALVQSEPEIFFMPGQVDLRYQWVEAWTAALEVDRLTELVLDAWAMVVPKSVSAPYFASLGADR
ncbi:MmcQ/YjbR family DNA-binding protein [Pedococcus bigeumensis]|uniref:MmcQ/YjbR family DNA-binding protein n=1 Tax=Pedococcus bigeumensis TaxID=433644 RepID=A0A502CZK5_9MICO|nr:MmcQ/YjbR family DNA-binding protein [Pedococcus bigeumensis]TPG17191.1 MmcQ/YjbR family DNA-binding protein [Pedococcus bigeumensis]